MDILSADASTGQERHTEEHKMLVEKYNKLLADNEKKDSELALQKKLAQEREALLIKTYEERLSMRAKQLEEQQSACNLFTKRIATLEREVNTHKYTLSCIDAHGQQMITSDTCIADTICKVGPAEKLFYVNLTLLGMRASEFVKKSPIPLRSASFPLSHFRESPPRSSTNSLSSATIPPLTRPRTKSI